AAPGRTCGRCGRNVWPRRDRRKRSRWLERKGCGWRWRRRGGADGRAAGVGAVANRGVRHNAEGAVPHPDTGSLPAVA
ncbi:unnamed protein product, partial [Ectocarpus sp. 12 AP-2014]